MTADHPLQTPVSAPEPSVGWRIDSHQPREQGTYQRVGRGDVLAAGEDTVVAGEDTVVAVPIGDAATARRRRPRDRKQQILTAAARQFWDLGYDQVSMADIAAAVGIGASALYRHFRGKQELLFAVLDETLAQLERTASLPQDIDGTIKELAGIAVDRREFGALWDWDAARLPGTERRALRDRLRSVITRTAEVVAADLGMEPAVARLRTHALYVVMASPSRHRVDPGRPGFEELLMRAAAALLDAELPEERGTLPSRRRTPGGEAQLPASRREAILAASIRLFDQRGYPSVGMTDIGTAIGIAGPSVYNHFASKADILAAALIRGNEALWLALHRALAGADSAGDALERVLDSYVAFATQNPALVSVFLSEVNNLPLEQREPFRRSQQEYVYEWVALLRRSRPEVEEPQARILVHAVLALPNDLVRVRRFEQRPNLAAEIAALGRSMLKVSTR